MQGVPPSLVLRAPLALLAAVLLVGIFSTEAADTDFWWHLKTGEYIVEHGKLPVPDPFSYTSGYGEPAYPGEETVRYFNLTHEWLAQVLWWLLYRLGGFPAVVLWKGFLLGLVCGAAGFLAARRAKNFYLGLFAALAPVPVLTLFAADRPALVTFALVAVFVVVLDSYVSGGRAVWLWMLIPLHIVWANSHGGFFLGWGVLAAYGVGAWRLPAARRKPLWLAAGLCILLSGLNPNGFRILEVLPAYRESYLTSTLIEWKRPFLWGPPYTYNLLLYSAAAAMMLAWRKLRLSDVLLFAAFGSASLMAFRNMVFVAFLAPVLMATYAWPLLAPKLPRLPVGVVKLLLSLGLAGLLVYQALVGDLYQLRAAEWKFPKGAAEFLREKRITDPIFNSYEYGGYLIWALWPEQRTFIDGRALNEAVYRDYVKILHIKRSAGPKGKELRTALLDRYDVQFVVTNAFEFASGVIYPLALALAGPSYPEWVLVYEDTQALVFARDAPRNRSLIERHRLDKSVLPDHLWRACSETISRSPLLPNCARSLGFLLRGVGDLAGARRALSLYLETIDYPDPRAREAYERLVRN